MISFWFCDHIIIFLLDSDAAEGTISSTAKAVNNSLRKVDIIDTDINTSKVIINSLYTDAGGGETREGLALELHKLQRCLDLELLLVITCILHAMNRMVQSPCEKYLESGGVSSRNYIQLLYIYYTLQKEYKPSEWNKIWLDTCGILFGEIFSAPIYTRQKYISMVLVKFVEKMEGFEKVALGIVNTEKNFFTAE